MAPCHRGTSHCHTVRYEVNYYTCVPGFTDHEKKHDHNVVNSRSGHTLFTHKHAFQVSYILKYECAMSKLQTKNVCIYILILCTT